jgi:hypothetical protein
MYSVYVCVCECGRIAYIYIYVCIYGIVGVLTGKARNQEEGKNNKHGRTDGRRNVLKKEKKKYVTH